MRTVKLKNIPEPLYAYLENAAATHRRSLNSEILYCLEEALAPQKRDSSNLVEEARRIREITAHCRLDPAELELARNTGRLVF